MANFVTLITFFSSLTLISSTKEKANWQKDMSNDIKIGVTTEGFKQAVLECSADWMAFVITFEKEFTGLVYTRGSFYNREGPCFKKSHAKEDLALKIPYNKCGSKYDSSESGYVNTIIVQHDDDVIMPGDLAFKIVCKDERAVTGSIEGIKSLISLVDPDPSVQESSGGSFSAMSGTNLVTIQPMKSKIGKEKEEL